ncbi:MAG: hypothetical protein HXX16_18925 [Bacteroidales bacterium]|nr:hypothetical protein [Bacteroidales bacterium]
MYSINCKIVDCDFVSDPFLNGKPIYPYSILIKIIDEVVPGHYGKYKFFSNIVGDTFSTSYNDRSTDTSPCLKVVDKYKWQ